MSQFLNKKFIISSLTGVFLIILLLNFYSFNYLKSHEKKVNQNFYDQLQLLLIYWKKIFITDELELIGPGMEFSSVPIYYQNLLIQLKENLAIDDVKILDPNQIILVDHDPVFQIGTVFNIDTVLWQNIGHNPEKMSITTITQASSPIVRILLSLLNSDDELKAVLYLQIQPEILADLQHFKQFNSFYMSLVLFLTFFLGVIIIIIFIRYSPIIEKQYHEQRLVQLGELAATVAHEIRNPLSIMKGSANILKKKNKDNKDLDLIHYIEDEINRLDEMINHLLQFVKVPRLELLKFEIGNIIDEILSNYRDSFPGIKITHSISNIWVLTDKKAFTQVLINILNNAVHAVNQPGINTPEIKIHSELERQRVIIVIENNGSIIPHKILNKIFDPFFTTNDQGNGLGLPTCKMLMQAMGGDITVSNIGPDWGLVVKLVLKLK